MKEERRMILQMVEEGKITAEEGVALLEALEKSRQEEESDNLEKPAKPAGRNPGEPTDNLERKEGQPEHKTGQPCGPMDAAQEDRSVPLKPTRDAEDFDLEAVKKEIVSKAEKIKKELTSQGKSVTHRLGDLIEKVVAKVREIDFDFDFPLANGVRVEKLLTGTLPDKGIIELWTVNGDVKIEGWDKPDYRIRIKGFVKAENETEGKAILNELLHVEEEEERLAVKIDRRKGSRISMEVHLPRRVLPELNVVTSNGSIELEELELKEARLETYNGRIEIEECRASGLFCSTSNGKIEMEDSRVEELYAKSSNGMIRLEGVIQHGKCRTSNGSIRYYLREPAEGFLDLKTNNGSIDVRLPAKGLALRGEMVTTFGSLDCNLPDVEITALSKDVNNRHLRFESLEKDGKRLELICKTSNGTVRVLPLEE